MLKEKITDAIKQVVQKESIKLHEPFFNGNEKRYVNECIDTTYVSSVGQFVNKFQEKLKRFTNSKYIVPVINGTSALHIALRVCNVNYGDEVILPSLTFIATANSVSYCGAVPHFVDVDKETLGIDPIKLLIYLKKIIKFENKRPINKNTGRKVKAIIPMHTFGHPCKINTINEIAKQFNLKVVEDAAESLGSYFCGKHTGTFADTGVLSFNGNKIITTGGGGAILTNNKVIAEKTLHLTTTAKLKHDWEFIHDEIGYNYRMPNLNAALGCSQLEQIEDFLSSKRKLYHLYNSVFKDFSELKLFKEPKNSKSNYWLNTLILNEKFISEKKNILEYTNQKGIQTRPIWKPLHTLKPYNKCPRSDLQNTDKLYDSIINIPSSPSILISKST